VDLPHRIVDLECGKQVGVICAVSGGEHHSLVMSLSGNVYSFGRGDAGELGWKEADDAKGRVNSGYFAWKPQRVGSNLKNYAIKQINCGSHHNIAVAIGGENVFAWYVGGWFGWFFILFVGVWWCGGGLVVVVVVWVVVLFGSFGGGRLFDC
jgi:regulator of chromosome condensation